MLLHPLLWVGLLLAGVLQLRLLQERDRVVPRHLLQQTDAAASWQLQPAVAAVLLLELGLACNAACLLHTEYVACHRLLPARGLARGLLVVGTASAAQIAAAGWRRHRFLQLPLRCLSP